MGKINDYKIVNTNQEDNTTSTEQIPEVILDATKNTGGKVFELTHFGGFKDIIGIILSKKINPSGEIEKLTQFRKREQKADDYNEKKVIGEINKLRQYEKADDYNEQKAA
ncbi:MAG: hypothetical protein WC850_01685 [Candidatus Gracilibacteria bacterium]